MSMLMKSKVTAERARAFENSLLEQNTMKPLLLRKCRALCSLAGFSETLTLLSNLLVWGSLRSLNSGIPGRWKPGDKSRANIHTIRCGFGG